MPGKLEKFIAERFATGKYPAFLDMYFRYREKKELRKQERRANMTYAEIESAINRRYERMFGRKLDWDNPKTYNEKVNVSKVYMPTPEKTRLADKYLVREWIGEKLGMQYLVPLIGVYDSADEIDFASLPSSFVMKCTHDCGSVLLVKDKSLIDWELQKHIFNLKLKKNFAWSGFEMHYLDIKPRIIIERYLEGAINEYKFYCFGGKPYFCFVTFGRRFVDLAINFYDMNWELLPFTRSDHERYSGEAARPENYDAMKEIASVLCKGFDKVRVDMYTAGGCIYAGEMTFTTSGGLGKFVPDEWDYRIGELWPFDNTVRKKVLASHVKPYQA